MSAVAATLAASSVPVLATIGGTAAATVRAPGVRVRSGVQHIAAGAVFAAVASELVFDLVEARRIVPTIIGFALGTALMLAVRAGAERLERRPDAASSSLVAAVGIDVLVDGVVLGIGFAAGSRGGLLLTAALTLELVFLGLTVAAALGGDQLSTRRIFTTTAGIAALLPLGGVLGALAGQLPVALVTATIAFAAAALLYLVTEELLVEAHEVGDSTVATALFFLAFLAILTLDIGTR